MFLGVDYYPEYWDEKLIDSDIEKMAEMGVNIVRIGEFSWHRMEQTEGEYDFAFFDKVVHKLKAKGMKIIFGTPTATFPAWLAKKHGNQILSVDENGQQRSFGGRRVYCYNSEIYKEYCDGIVTRLVSHYRNEESIIAWQADNEPGHEGSDLCFCDTCKIEFQNFLKKKYGTIDKLNKAYGTIFWGQTYNDFTEIPLPKKTITQHNPALQLDHARFRSESLRGFMEEQASHIRRCMGCHQQLTINWEGGFFEKWFDFEKTAVLGDFISYDNYPVWGGLKEPLPPAEIAMGLDFIRGISEGLSSDKKVSTLKEDAEGIAPSDKECKEKVEMKDPSGRDPRGSFWVMEELMGAQGHQIIGYRPKPGQAAMWSGQAVAHGCSNLLYFSWRSMTRGTEQFCHGLMGHDNEPGMEAKEAEGFFHEMKQLGKEGVFIPKKATVAVLYDYDNVWSWRIQPQSGAFDFKDELMRLYAPFYDMNVSIDVIPSDRELSGYKVVVLPALQFISDELGLKLERFADAGGIVLCGFRAGVRDEYNNIREEALPGVMTSLCGVKVYGYEALQPEQTAPVKGVGAYSALSGECSVWRDLLLPTSGKNLFTYGDKCYEKYGCVTENRFGKGYGFYVGAGVPENILSAVTARIAELAGLEIISGVEGLELCAGKIAEREMLFFMNHKEEELSWNGKQIPPFGFGWMPKK